MPTSTLEGTVNLDKNDRGRPRDVGVRISLSHTILWSGSTPGAQVDNTFKKHSDEGVGS